MLRNIIIAIIAIIVLYFILSWAGIIGRTADPVETPPAATGTTTPPATN